MTSPQRMNSQLGFSLIIIVVVISLLAGVFYYIFVNSVERKVVVETLDLDQTHTSEKEERALVFIDGLNQIERTYASSHWNTFSLEELDTSIYYPKEWKSIIYNSYSFLDNNSPKEATVFRTYPKGTDGYWGNIQNKGVLIELRYSYLSPKEGLDLAENYNLSGIDGKLLFGNYYEEFTRNVNGVNVSLVVYYIDPKEEYLEIARKVVSSIQGGVSEDYFATNQEWVSTSDNNNNFSIDRPALSSVDVSNEYLKLIVRGPTQREGAELYDGVLVIVSKVDLDEDQTVFDYANNTFSNESQLVEERGGKVVSNVEEYSFGDLSGYRFVTENLGETDHFFVNSKEDGQAINVVRLVVDPTKQGYDQIADRIVASLKLL